MERIKLVGFVQESNRIEGIHRGITHPQTGLEIEAHEQFLALKAITVEALENFVAVVQPDAVLRDKRGLDVRVGNHIAPPGGPEIVGDLARLIHAVEIPGTDAHHIHMLYETLHPFTDGNGRSGRVLWLWIMGGVEHAPLGFLHHFYYQTLAASR